MCNVLFRGLVRMTSSSHHGAVAWPPSAWAIACLVAGLTVSVALESWPTMRVTLISRSLWAVSISAATWVVSSLAIRGNRRVLDDSQVRLVVVRVTLMALGVLTSFVFPSEPILIAVVYFALLVAALSTGSSSTLGQFFRTTAIALPAHALIACVSAFAFIVTSIVVSALFDFLSYESNPINTPVGSAVFRATVLGLLLAAQLRLQLSMAGRGHADPKG